MSYPESLEIIPLSKPPVATVRVPGSKSITNRALVLAALSAKGYAAALRGALRSEDTEVMIEALRAIGFRVFAEWPESTIYVSSDDGPIIPAREADLYVANSGTTMRFLTALVALGHGRYRLDGVPRMRERPIRDLLDALQQLGVKAFSEAGTDCPPVVVEADGIRGGHVRIKADVSSQFLSGLMMAAPLATHDVTITVDGPLVSWPYVFMTARMMTDWGFSIRHADKSRDDVDSVLAASALTLGERREWGEWVCRQAGGVSFFIRGSQEEAYERNLGQAEAATIREHLDPRRPVRLWEFAVEPDASAASYFFGAAAITGGEVTVAGLGRKSLQGDIRLAEVLADMGCELIEGKDGLTVRGGPLRGIDVDMNDISDTVMTLGAVACFADGPTTIRNVGHIRHKETDRLAALATELRRVGAGVEEFADGLTITPGPLHGAAIETYNDHRMAMSLALVGLRVPGVVIHNPGCAAKTYPDFFADLEKLR